MLQVVLWTEPSEGSQVFQRVMVVGAAEGSEWVAVDDVIHVLKVVAKHLVVEMGVLGILPRNQS